MLRSIADMAIEQDIWVLADEPYGHILFDGHQHFSIGSLEGMAQRTISAFTLSKSCAMTGCAGGLYGGAQSGHR